MRGVYRIERENTDGDRAIVATIDIEGLPGRQDALSVATARADELLVESGAFKMRVIHDDGWNYRVHATREVLREWRYTRHAPRPVREPGEVA